jgi:hypothetical protein
VILLSGGTVGIVATPLPPQPPTTTSSRWQQQQQQQQPTKLNAMIGKISE